ncbi:Rz1-like lysis system protein LysC [Celerinatantimonas diazotrophica]
MTKLNRGLLLVFPMLLSACSALPVQKIIVRIQHDKILLPQEYIQPTDEPKKLTIPAVNYDLVHYWIDLRAALQRCNSDKRSLRQWQDTQAN